MNTPLETINEIVKIYESTDMDNEVLDDIMRTIGETDPDKPAAGPWQDGPPPAEDRLFMIELNWQSNNDIIVERGNDEDCIKSRKWIKRHAPINLPEE